MIECPYCSQEDVWEVNVSGIKEAVVLCFECDTLWTKISDIADGDCCLYDEFMESNGLPQDWSLAVKIRQI